MTVPIFCNSERRRDAVRGRLDLNGIDFVEVSEDQLSIRVVFLNPLPGEPDGVPAGATLGIDNVRVDGGVRITNIGVTSVVSEDRVLTVGVSSPGDFSNYTLRLAASSVDSLPPAGFDPQLSTVVFNFKVGCPTDFDCRDDASCEDPIGASIEIDYLAKDYASFRQLMLDTISRVRPGEGDPNPASLEGAIVETLAYVADRLSYFQDAVVTEAYLSTSRLRTSVRRHARLLGYFVSEGCNARTWIAFEASSGQDGTVLPIGSQVFASDIDAPPTLSNVEFAKVSKSAIVFETMQRLTLREARNEIEIYAWSDEECCLPEGTTACTLVNDPDLQLFAGKVLIFEEVRHPETGDATNANRDHRHAVRLTRVTPTVDPVTNQSVVEVEWHTQDALPFSLRVSGRFADLGGDLVAVAVVRGNVVLADHGRSLANQNLVPAQVPQNERYLPTLELPNVTFATPRNPQSGDLPAAAVLATDPRSARPAIQLRNVQGVWKPQADLLSSDRFALDFVAEALDDRTLQLRFGDDVLGTRPRENTTLIADVRIGSGREGNVGIDRLGCLVADQPVVTRVWNPLAAVGGTDPEPIEDVKRDAPEAFRTQRRAVTEQDWADRALEFMFFGERAIQRAVAEFRWTGSWYTVFITVDRTGGRSTLADAPFRAALLNHLEPFRIAGYDLELRDPVYVPLELRLFVCARTGYFRSDIQRRVLEALSNRGSGLFNPDQFTFGESVYLSQIVAVVEAIDGVDSVEVTTFQRFGKGSAGELSRGYLTIAAREIARLDNDPNFAENGVLEVNVGGGL